ncbi:uncharacterized protein fmt [Epargyreus clarus]|uniref:uncharacterized protein fmt n=1 Tax=Epargyreus clarus TaxID=520877 RepID=UPI003C30771B
MFWSGNYIVVRELNFLLQEENVTLSQVLEADDILQECKADNKALMSFLTKPEILAELISLILEEPPKDVELSTQYRHANIASEVLTSELSMLSNQLSMDVAQMNRICDFVKKDPPLNPLLASYFSKTIGMLLEQSHKQDWCLYHIVCLRVLDFFRARRDFLPNLLRHMSTSAIADTFKYFIRLDYPFNKIIMEWFEEHQFLESLIQIICGTYDPPEVHYDPVVAIAQDEAPKPPEPEVKQEPNQVELPEEQEKAQQEYAEKLDNQKDIEKSNRIDNRSGNMSSGAALSLDSANGNDEPEAEPGALQRCNAARAAAAAAAAAGAARRRAERAARLRAVAADNAAALLCDLLANAAGLACDLSTSRFSDPWYSRIHIEVVNEHVITVVNRHLLLSTPYKMSPYRRPWAAVATFIRCTVHCMLVYCSYIIQKNMVDCTVARYVKYAYVLTCVRCVRVGSKRKASALAWRLRGDAAVRALLAGMFTAAGAARRSALVAGARVLLALLQHDLQPDGATEEVEPVDTASVERAIAPHIPLLHHALLRDPALDVQEAEQNSVESSSGHGSNGEAACSQSGSQSSTGSQDHATDGEGSSGQGSAAASGQGSAAGSGADSAAGSGADSVGCSPERGAGRAGGVGRPVKAVGAARLGAAALLAQLACSEVDDVPTALISLGTAGVLAALAFEHEHNNFLHAQLHALVRNALANRRHALRYAAHLIEECNLLTQLMDLFEENEDKRSGRARAGYMGHVVLLLRRFHELPALPAAPAALLQRWDAFRDARLRPLLQRHDTPLCGFYPSENSYEVENMADTMASNYDLADAGGGEGDELEGLEGLQGLPALQALDAAPAEGGAGGDDPNTDLKETVKKFIELANQRFEFESWDDTPAAAPALQLSEPSPWESAEAGGSGAGACGGECWANFAEPFDTAPFWPYDANDPNRQPELERGLERMQLEDDASEELANNLRTAMSSMTPDVIANIVNANLALDDDAER